MGKHTSPMDGMRNINLSQRSHRFSSSCFARFRLSLMICFMSQYQFDFWVGEQFVALLFLNFSKVSPPLQFNMIWLYEQWQEIDDVVNTEWV